MYTSFHQKVSYLMSSKCDMKIMAYCTKSTFITKCFKFSSSKEYVCVQVFRIKNKDSLNMNINMAVKQPPEVFCKKVAL